MYFQESRNVQKYSCPCCRPLPSPFPPWLWSARYTTLPSGPRLPSDTAIRASNVLAYTAHKPQCRLGPSPLHGNNSFDSPNLEPHSRGPGLHPARTNSHDHSSQSCIFGMEPGLWGRLSEVKVAQLSGIFHLCGLSDLSWVQRWS